MGVSTDGILFFGYCLDIEDERPPWWTDGGSDEEEAYAKAVGVIEPADEYPADADLSPGANAIRTAFRDYWKRRGEVHATSGCSVVRHCSHEYPMWAIAIEASRHRAMRGYPVKVDPSKLVTDPAWKAMLTDYCAKLGATVPTEEPAWWLVSDWG